MQKSVAFSVSEISQITLSPDESTLVITAVDGRVEEVLLPESPAELSQFQLAFSDDLILDLSEIATNFNIDELTTAAGPTVSADGSGSGSYGDDAGALIDGLDRMGMLDGLKISQEGNSSEVNISSNTPIRVAENLASITDPGGIDPKPLDPINPTDPIDPVASYDSFCRVIIYPTADSSLLDSYNFSARFVPIPLFSEGKSLQDPSNINTISINGELVFDSLVGNSFGELIVDGISYQYFYNTASGVLMLNPILGSDIDEAFVGNLVVSINGEDSYILQVVVPNSPDYVFSDIPVPGSGSDTDGKMEFLGELHSGVGRDEGSYHIQSAEDKYQISLDQTLIGSSLGNSYALATGGGGVNKVFLNKGVWADKTKTGDGASDNLVIFENADMTIGSQKYIKTDSAGSANEIYQIDNTGAQYYNHVYTNILAFHGKNELKANDISLQAHYGHNIEAIASQGKIENFSETYNKVIATGDMDISITGGSSNTSIKAIIARSALNEISVGKDLNISTTAQGKDSATTLIEAYNNGHNNIIIHGDLNISATATSSTKEVNIIKSSYSSSNTIDTENIYIKVRGGEYTPHLKIIDSSGSSVSMTAKDKIEIIATGNKSETSVWVVNSLHSENIITAKDIDIRAQGKDCYGLNTHGSSDAEGLSKIIGNNINVLLEAEYSAYGMVASVFATNTIGLQPIYNSEDLSYIPSSGSLTLNLIVRSENSEAIAMKAGSNLTNGFRKMGLNQILGGDGDDFINIEGSLLAEKFGQNKIETYGGDDTVIIKGNISSESTGEYSSNTINTGSGNDTIIVKGDFSATGNSANIIDAGSGNDHIILDGKVNPGGLSIKAGEGFDVLTLNFSNENDYLDWLNDLLSSSNSSTGLELIHASGDLDPALWAELNDIVNAYNASAKDPIKVINDDILKELNGGETIFDDKGAFTEGLMDKLIDAFADGSLDDAINSHQSSSEAQGLSADSISFMASGYDHDGNLSFEPDPVLEIIHPLGSFREMGDFDLLSKYGELGSSEANFEVHLEENISFIDLDFILPVDKNGTVQDNKGISEVTEVMESTNSQVNIEHISYDHINYNEFNISSERGDIFDDIKLLIDSGTM